MSNPVTRLIATAALLAGLSAVPALADTDPASGPWVAQYAALLSQYTEAVDTVVGTRVDYRGLLREPAWKRLIADLAATNPADLKTRDDRLAYWINVYNIFAIDIVLQNYPVEGIKDIGSLFRPVWKRPAGTLAGRQYTLDEIEHEILRPMGEPRIHSAIVCASVSCPDLRREPYRPAELDAQLTSNMREWLANEKKGLAVDRAEDELWLSPILKWFSEDFDAQGGVIAVVTRYAPETDQAWLRAKGADADVEYFDYDWNLNQ